MRVGILGGGQLGRMLALAGIPLGIKFVFYDPNPEACAKDLGKFFHGEFNDHDQLEKFSREVDVVTVESENIPVSTLEYLQQHVQVFPEPNAIEISQDRLFEKKLFEKLGIPTPKFFAINSINDLKKAFKQHKKTLMVKTRQFGYDGKGQAQLTQAESAQEIWDRLGARPLIAEQRMNFTREVSIIASRNRHGVINFYPLIENLHHEGILLRSHATRNDPLQATAENYARRLLQELDYAGTLTFEFFDCNGKLVANEIAPRVHNSGHWTIEGAVTNQFENHLRAILGWPLGVTNAHTNCVMYNIIGEIPDSIALLRIPGIHLHHYGKSARPGRKLGHITLCRPNPDVAEMIEDLLWHSDVVSGKTRAAV